MPYADPAKRREAKQRYKDANREKIREADREYMRRKRGNTENVKPVRRHGLTKHPLWNTWHMMMQRCYNPNATRYTRYGGRGIGVCPEWHDVVAFISWIEANLGPRPAGMTLDRLDNEGDYEPGKVRWATAKEQQRHRQHDEQGRWATSDL